MNVLKRFSAGTQGLRNYVQASLRGDLVAGLTVGVMLIPMSMAYAVLAGLPPLYGLYASLVPLVIYPIFGTSRHLAVGTVAIDMVIVAVGLGALAEPGSARYIELAVLLAMMVGVLQMFIGVARLGFVVTLLSRPVIVGFTSAAVLIIGFSQLGNLLGVRLPHTQQVFVILRETIRQAGQIKPWSVALGAGGIALLVGLGRWKRLIPGALVAVVLGTLVVWGLKMDQQGVAVVGAIPTGLPRPALPALDVPTVQALLPTALALVLVQFLSVVSLGKIFAARHRYWIQPNRELFAIGLVALTLAFLTPLFYYLPVPILAAIIIVAVFSLLDVGEIRYLIRAKRIDGGLAILTFFATFFIGILQGILIGVVASVVAVMYRISRPNIAVLGHLPHTRSFRDIDRHSDAKPIDGILILRVDASFSFANAEYLKDFILEASQAEDSPVRAVVIDASTMNDLDMTAVGVLIFVAETLREREIDLYISGVKGAAKDVAHRSGLVDAVGPDHLFLSPHRAVKHILAGWGRVDDYLEAVPGGQELVE
jgi:SulP family sulfate permease